MVVRFLVLTLALSACLLGPVVRADDLPGDVPGDVRKHYEKAQAYFAAGDFDRAFSTLAKAKAKHPDSVDFWLLYVRIWRALGKKESTLWEKTIAKAEAQHPDSLTFDMLRWHLEEDAEVRLELLQKMVEKKPDAIGPKLLLAQAYVEQEDDDLAEEVLDEILEKDPANELAQVTKGDLLLASGFSRSALDHAEETLAEHAMPGLHDLAARALIRVAENDAAALDRALVHARKAVEGRKAPAFILTLVDILDQLGKDDEAVAVLSVHTETTPVPELLARLGRYAFRTGDYENAARGLATAPASDVDAAFALCLCHARRGLPKEAEAALARLPKEHPSTPMVAAAVELLLGDAPLARTFLTRVSGDEGAFLEIASWAWQGKSGEVKTRAGAKARDGSREGEEYLLLLTQARLLARLGPKAKKARKLLLESRYKAARAGTPGAAVPESEPSVAAKSRGFMGRCVSYRKALDGSWFEPGQFSVSIDIIDGEPVLRAGLLGTSRCARDRSRLFPFNAQSQGGAFGLDDHAEVWKAASEAFQAGCGATVDERWNEATEAFETALEQEAAWARAKLFLAVALASPGGDIEKAATLAAEAADALADDWEGRQVALLIRLLAGQDVATDAQVLAERIESFSVRRYEEFPWNRSR